jgi:hypothetical protein
VPHRVRVRRPASGAVRRTWTAAGPRPGLTQRRRSTDEVRPAGSRR